jgi:hypothetical protein
MLPLQLLSLLFALAMVYWTYLSFRRKTIRLFELLFWVCAWGGFALIVLFPGTTNIFLERLNVNRTMDLMLILGFMLVWVVLFADHLETRRLRQRLHELVRQIALKDGEEQER